MSGKRQRKAGGEGDLKVKERQEIKERKERRKGSSRKEKGPGKGGDGEG